MLDPDTFTSPESHEVALLAAGAAIEAAFHARATGEPALALVRPPGHHAEPDRAMGFCLYNNIAVAAAALRADGVERVAIVDIDVHHGNGTQAAFYRDASVLYVSSHQFPFYPGTGAASETGEGPGKGFTLNVPLEAGATDDIYARAVRVPRRSSTRLLRARSHTRLRWLRRPRPGSARRDAHDREGILRGSFICSMTLPGVCAADGSPSSPRVAITSKHCASAWRRRWAC